MFYRVFIVSIFSLLLITLTACEDKEKIEREKQQATAKKLLEYKPLPEVKHKYFNP